MHGNLGTLTRPIGTLADLRDLLHHASVALRGHVALVAGFHVCERRRQKLRRLVIAIVSPIRVFFRHRERPRGPVVLRRLLQRGHLDPRRRLERAQTAGVGDDEGVRAALHVQHLSKFVAHVHDALALPARLLTVLAEHLDVPLQVKYRAADVVVDGVHSSLVVGADLELQLGYLGHRAGVEHEHAPEVGSGGEDALQTLGLALLGGWVGDDAEDVAEQAGLQLGLLSFQNLCEMARWSVDVSWRG